MTIANIK